MALTRKGFSAEMLYRASGLKLHLFYNFSIFISLSISTDKEQLTLEHFPIIDLLAADSRHLRFPQVTQMNECEYKQSQL